LKYLKKKKWANFQRIIELFTQKLSICSQKPIPDPGSRGQKGAGSRIRIRNTVTKFETWVTFMFLGEKCVECEKGDDITDTSFDVIPHSSECPQGADSPPPLPSRCSDGR
jgi:hypothetical protein